jgi:hypothetical protein
LDDGLFLFLTPRRLEKATFAPELCVCDIGRPRTLRKTSRLQRTKRLHRHRYRLPNITREKERCKEIC